MVRAAYPGTDPMELTYVQLVSLYNKAQAVTMFLAGEKVELQEAGEADAAEVELAVALGDDPLAGVTVED